MITSATSTTSTAAATSGTATKADPATDPNAAQDRFLKLLVAQLNNQDPMNPLDNAQMTSQMAQINTVTGIQQLNQTMKSMADQFSALQVLQGASMIGRSVVTEGNNLPVADGVGKGMFDLSAAAGDVKVEVLTAGGQLVGSVDLGAQTQGRHQFEWDASKYAGSKEGLRFKVTALNGSTAVESTPLLQSKVVSAGADGGLLTLDLEGGGTVTYSQVKAIL
ncbi:flagellar hook capping protein [Acidovorax delafieldii 2AN]|uniref:Basal-body rod modification protein FlgD n=1 Tax=Acidovorax delafieldii 2AN TaxID=573060 RepID=C5TAM6_ACIDE|nr:flagellar hook assembly protein FlgD [Acidovorax delafieldii]EER58471.1 flagellar hook capping protein [Acidovorax delafieldii 2AN]